MHNGMLRPAGADKVKVGKFVETCVAELHCVAQT